MARPRLLAINPIDETTREFRIAKAEVTIGSASGNTLLLRHPGVSRRHAVIRAFGRHYEVLDLKSTNGTFVNERRIDTATPLGDGDHVRFGAAAFVFADPDAARRIERKGRSIAFRAFGAALILLATGFAAAEYVSNRQLVIEELRALSGAIESEWTAPSKAGLLPVSSASSAPEAIAPASPRPSSTPQAAAPAGPDWLARINYYRAMVKLLPVKDDRALSESDSKHAHYLMLNFGDAIRKDRDLGDDEQDERPGKPGYSADGAAVAINSEVAYGCGSFSAVDEIDRFMAGAFHRLALLGPRLGRAALGSYVDHACWAAAVRIPIPASNPRTFDHPIEFPPDGATVSLRWKSGEWPDPLKACPDYEEPAGVPISLELGRMIPAQLSAHSLSENGRPLKHCAFDNATYTNPNAYAQEYARRALREFGAVVLIPKEPLHDGASIAVSVTARGQTYAWSFKTAAEPR
jgi:FHA domain